MSRRENSSLARALAVALAGSILLFSGACMCRLSVPSSVCLQRTTEGPLPGRALELCLVIPVVPPSPPVLILYATGDGGWEGASKAVFQHLAERGYPVVGFSARDYLKDLRRDRTFISPDRMARDLDWIIDSAKVQMSLPAGTPTILVGVSRGAEFMVAAAAQPSLQPRPAGAVALALTRETDYVRNRPTSKRKASKMGSSRMESGQILSYVRLKEAIDIPIAVIQSTHDRYLPAAEASTLFGGDTSMRHFMAIEAKNHGFGGARDVMLQELDNSLGWIESLMKQSVPPPAAAPSTRP